MKTRGKKVYGYVKKSQEIEKEGEMVENLKKKKKKFKNFMRKLKEKGWEKK